MRLRTSLPILVCLALPVFLVAQIPSPVISNVTPSPITVSNPDLTITVTGSNFCESALTVGDTVEFQPPNSPYSYGQSTTFVSTTELTAVVDPSLNSTTGTAVVTVASGCTESQSNQFNLIVVPQPTIGDFTPSAVAVGGPGFNLTITGTNFVNGMKASWCLNGCDGPGATVLTPASITATQMVVPIASSLYNTTGTATIAVIMPDGFTTTAQFPLTVYGAPAITSLQPNVASAGSPAIVLTIPGNNFVTNDVVLWNGAALTGAVYDTDAHEITVTVPATLLLTPGTANVTVRDPGGAVSAPALFTIAGPSISSLSPASASAGAASFSLTIQGANFAGSSTATWTPPSSSPVSLAITSQTATQIVATVPSTLLTASGTATVTVTNPGGSSANAPFAIGGPAIVSLSSTSIASGSPTFNLTVTGTNLVSGSVVRWGTTALTTVGSVTATQIAASVPSTLLNTSGPVSVTVQNPGGATSNALTFTVNGPALTSLSSTSIASGSPTFNLTATGTNFASGAVLRWGTTVLSTVGSVTATQITASVASTLLNTSGPVSVTVQNPGGTTSNALTFTVNGPTLTSLSSTAISSGSAGFNLTVTGTNFASGSVVRWGNTSLSTVGSGTATQITASVPSSLLSSAGPVSITVQSPGGVTSNALTFTVTGPAITSLNPTTMPSGSSPFTLTVTGTNFISGSTVYWNSTALPTASSATATQISATVATALLATVGTVSVTVRNPGGATSNAVSFTVSPPTLVITTTGLSPEVVGIPYSVTLTGSGGVPPYTWSASGLPQGFTLNSATGLLSGTSNTVGNSTITVQLTDSNNIKTSKTFTLLVTAPALSVQTEALPHGVVGVAYSQTVSAAGGTPPYTWSVNQGTLPPGLTLQSSSGLISGKPDTAGTYPVGLLVTDSSNAVSGRLFTLVVDATGLTITTMSLPDGAVGTPYTSPALQVTGGKAPYTWALGTGSKAGFTIGASTGVIAGTMQSAGSATFVVQVTDSAGAAGSKTFTVNFGTGFMITTAALNGAAIGVAYPAVQLGAAGGTEPYTWSVSAGALPAGLALDAGGILSGTPTAQGQSGFTVQAQDAHGQKASKSFQIVVATPVEIGAITLADGTLGKAYSAAFTATGGIGPYTWSAGNGLPGGITFNSGGTLAGTPTHAGTFNFTVTATDTAGRTATKTLSLKIASTLAIATTTITGGVAGSTFTAPVQAAGGTPPYTFSASGLPAGLAIDPNTGQIGGTPTAAGAFTVAVTVTDGDKQTVSATYNVSITAPPLSGAEITGVPADSGPAQQSPLSVKLNSQYALDITGTLKLAFASSAGGDDRMVQFSTGGRTTTYTIPAGDTQAAFSNPQGVSILTGTVAGTITITTTLTAGGQNITPSPAPTQTIVIPKSAPVITSLKVTRNSTGFTVVISGYSTPRDMTQATFQFTAASGATLQSTTVTVPLTPAFSTWYGSADSNQFGSQFTLTLPFTIQGGAGTVTGLTATLTNSVGTSSPPAPANF